MNGAAYPSTPSGSAVPNVKDIRTDLSPTPLSSHDHLSPDSILDARDIKTAWIEFRRRQKLDAADPPVVSNLRLSPAAYQHFREELKHDTHCRRMWNTKQKIRIRPRHCVFDVSHGLGEAQPGRRGDCGVHRAAAANHSTRNRCCRSTGVQTPPPTYGSVIHFRESPNLRKAPDASFRHEDSHYPGVVIEISFAQQKKDLKKLAIKYINDSNGDIKAMLGVDMTYPHGAASVFLWRARDEKGDDGKIRLEIDNLIKNQMFRTVDGESVYHPDIQIPLTDFAHDYLTTNLGGEPSPYISIPMAVFVESVARVEKHQKQTENPPANRYTRVAKIKRSCSESSEEALCSEDESVFAKAEEAVDEKMAAGDQTHVD